MVTVYLNNKEIIYIQRGEFVLKIRATENSYILKEIDNEEKELEEQK